MAQPSMVTDVVLTLRCGHPYRGGACRRAVGWVGRSDGGVIRVELLTLERRDLHEQVGEEDFALVGRWWEELDLVPLAKLLGDIDDPFGTRVITAWCDRHGSCRFTVAALEAALRVHQRDLTSA